MKFKKKTEKNIFAEGLENSVLHPYVKSSYNFINEDLDDEIEIGNEEVPVEDNSEGTPETPKPGVETGYSNMLINAINGEWDTIELYNSIIATLSLEKDKKYDAIIKILQDITNEENVHVGQLQKALEILSPNTSSIKDGEEEADEQISSDDYDDIVESLLMEDEITVETDKEAEEDGQSDDKTTSDTENSEEERGSKEQLEELFSKTGVSLKDAATAEKLTIVGVDGNAKDSIAEAISRAYGSDSVSPEQLEAFEKNAGAIGSEINIGKIAKQYGMQTGEITNQVLGATWNDDKIKLTFYALSTALLTDPNKFLAVSKELLEKVPDDKLDEILEEVKKLSSFNK